MVRGLTIRYRMLRLIVHFKHMAWSTRYPIHILFGRSTHKKHHRRIRINNRYMHTMRQPYPLPRIMMHRYRHTRRQRRQQHANHPLRIHSQNIKNRLYRVSHLRILMPPGHLIHLLQKVVAKHEDYLFDPPIVVGWAGDEDIGLTGVDFVP